MGNGIFADRRDSSWQMLRALVAADGSSDQPMVRALTRPDAKLDDLADAVHHLCQLHGRYPGVIDLAANRTDGAALSDWLTIASAAFAIERGNLARLAAAAGPVPSTPGQAESQASVIAQRHAVETLAASDRHGCAAGAAFALVLDWPVAHHVLERAAERLGITIDPLGLPPEFESMRATLRLADTVSTERAMMFGAQQLLAQQRGWWGLLDARASARSIS